MQPGRANAIQTGHDGSTIRSSCGCIIPQLAHRASHVPIRLSARVHLSVVELENLSNTPLSTLSARDPTGEGEGEKKARQRERESVCVCVKERTSELESSGVL